MADFDQDYLQTKIHAIAELDADPPSSGEDDYTIRTHLINKWIKSWENEDGMLWNELYKLGSIPSTGATSYALSSFSMTDFKRPGGFVYDDLNNYYNVIQPEEVQLLVPSTTSLYSYFLGNQGAGYTIYFGASYPATGRTISVPYYKTATELTLTTSKPEMSDPYYIIHGVVSDLLSTEDPSESTKHFQIAQNIMKNMKLRNYQVPYWQSNQLPNLNARLGTGGFGV